MWVVDVSSKKPEAFLQGSHLGKNWVLEQEVELRGGLEGGGRRAFILLIWTTPPNTAAIRCMWLLSP